MAYEELIGLGTLAAFGVMYLVVFLALYIYQSWATMVIAKKTKTENGWLAFIPIANVYLATQMAGLSGWWTLIIFAALIPFIGSLALIGVMIWMWWIIAEKIGRPGWWSLLLLIPIVNFVVIGIMAWGKK